MDWYERPFTPSNQNKFQDDTNITCNIQSLNIMRFPEKVLVSKIDLVRVQFEI